MGIWERPPAHFLDALQQEFGFDPPREHGFDTVQAIEALRDGKAKVFIGMGGNFVSAAPDTEVTEQAMRNADLTVHVSTKLNRSHVVTGREALILPALGRSEKDLTGGRVQRVTVEDSMSAVHASHGPLKPASPHLKSEVDIVCSLALATLGDRYGIPWDAFRSDYTEIRHRIARVVPGCAAYDEKVSQPGGFVLPHPPRDSRTFKTEAGKAMFTDQPDRRAARPGGPAAAADAALARPVQHHDLRPRRPLPRHQERPPGGLRAPRRHRGARPRGRLDRRPGQRVVGRVGAPRAGVPGGALRAAARLRGGVLPGDESPDPVGIHGHRQQLPDLEVRDRAARAAGRRCRASARPATPARSRPATTKRTVEPEHLS